MTVGGTSLRFTLNGEDPIRVGAGLEVCSSGNHTVQTYDPATNQLVGVATALTASGLPIVDTMVSVNVVYIASVGVSLVGLLRGTEPRGVDDAWVIAAGVAAAVAVYVAAWLVVPIPNVELVALVAGLTTATATRVALGRRERDLACDPAHR